MVDEINSMAASILAPKTLKIGMRLVSIPRTKNQQTNMSHIHRKGSIVRLV